MANNHKRIALMRDYIERAQLTIVEWIGTDAHVVKARCSAGTSETRMFSLTVREGDMRGDLNEFKRMQRFYREIHPEDSSALAQALIAAAERAPQREEFKHVRISAPAAPPGDDAPRVVETGGHLVRGADEQDQHVPDVRRPDGETLDGAVPPVVQQPVERADGSETVARVPGSEPTTGQTTGSAGGAGTEGAPPTLGELEGQIAALLAARGKLIGQRPIRPLVPIARGRPPKPRAAEVAVRGATPDTAPTRGEPVGNTEGPVDRTMPVRLSTRQQATLIRMLRWFEEQGL